MQPRSIRTRVPEVSPTRLVDRPEELARLLESHPDYRVLRRLVPRTDFGVKPLGPVGRLVILDTETTGLDNRLDRIIELALLVVEVDTTTGEEDLGASEEMRLDSLRGV